MKTFFLDRVVLCVGLIAMSAVVVHGAEIKLFEPAVSHEICLFDGHDLPAAGAPTSLDLFECTPPITVNAVAGECVALNLFAPDEQASEATRAKPEATPPSAAKPDTRPVIVVWSPRWCGVCSLMEDMVGNGDEAVRVRWIKGDPQDIDDEAFPMEVRRYARSLDSAGLERGYPVLQYQPVDGKGGWLFAPKARSMPDIHALAKLKMKDAIPASTFQQSLRDSLPKLLPGGAIETAPKVAGTK